MFYLSVLDKCLASVSLFLHIFIHTHNTHTHTHTQVVFSNATLQFKASLKACGLYRKTGGPLVLHSTEEVYLLLTHPEQSMLTRTLSLTHTQSILPALPSVYVEAGGH